MALKALDVQRLDAGLHGDGNGLYLQVTATGARSWVYRFALGGAKRYMGLGSAADISLKLARELRDDAARLKAQGIDPIGARDAKTTAAKVASAKVVTFKEYAQTYIDAHKAGWSSDKHLLQWENSLANHAYPVLGDIPVPDIDTPLVLKALRPIWTTKTETANRVRGRIEMVLDSAKVDGLRTGENPARWRGHLKFTLAAPRKIARRTHFAALPYEAVFDFMSDLAPRHRISARCLEFTILTCARSNESRHAEWSEIDIDKALWTIPAAKMKGRKEHVVPLAPRVVALLRALHPRREGRYIFPGQRPGKPISDMSMLKVLVIMGHDDITVHGFRSTFRDWVSECTNYSDSVAEMCLAHAIENEVEAAYRRGKLIAKRAELMAAWAQYCVTPASDNVVAFAPVKNSA